MYMHFATNLFIFYFQIEKKNSYPLQKYSDYLKFFKFCHLERKSVFPPILNGWHIQPFKVVDYIIIVWCEN